MPTWGFEPRVRLIGAYFDLTDRFTPSIAAGSGDRAAGQVGGRVLISVAKRLVPSAVRRNTVKRIVRESWRAALKNQPVTPSMQQAVQDVQECLIRLKRYPGARIKPVGARRQGTGAAKAQPQAEPQPPPGLGLLKGRLRADADQLFATYLRRRPTPRSRPLAGVDAS